MVNYYKAAVHTTLSLDNPLPLSGDSAFSEYLADISNDNYVFPEAYARARTAINYLRSIGVEKVVVGGFSLGARIATAYLARGHDEELPVLGLLGVGMYATHSDPLNIAMTIDEVSVPALDVYGDNDVSASNTAASRLSAYELGVGSEYSQIILSCSDGTNCHQLEGLKGSDSEPLEIAVNAWMQAVAPAGVVSQCESPDEPDGGGSGGGLSIYILAWVTLILTRIRR